MSIRRTVRKALRSGTTMYAKVEEVHLGLVTVRLGGTGARMVNLSTVGGEVEKDDTVIVDWSAGVNPIVRPLFIEDEPEIPLAVSAPEGNLDYEDYSCLVGSYYGWDEDMGWYENYPNLMRMAYFHDTSWFRWDLYWDAGGFVDTSAFIGQEFITIPRSGKYLIHFVCNPVFRDNTVEWQNYNDGDLNDEDTYYRIRILKNYSTPLAEATGGWSIGYWGETSMQVRAFEYLESGDQINFELFWRSNLTKSINVDGWGYTDLERGKSIIYIPGT